MNNSILGEIKVRNQLYMQFKNDRNQQNWNLYKAAKNKVNTLVSEAKYEYFKNALEEKDTTGQWKMVNKLLSNKSKDVPPINADDFSEHLARIIGNKTNIHQSSDFLNFMGPRVDEACHFTAVNSIQAERILNSLSINKAGGMMGFPIKSSSWADSL